MRVDVQAALLYMYISVFSKNKIRYVFYILEPIFLDSTSGKEK